MAATVSQLIKKGGVIFYDGSITKSFKDKLDKISAHFGTIKSFKEISIDKINDFKNVDGSKSFSPLKDKEVEAILKFQKFLISEEPVENCFTRMLTEEFINKQLSMIEAINIDKLNANPILSNALNFDNPNDFLKYNIYQAISRSIVTSMGYLVENLLLYSNPYVFDGKYYTDGNKTKWDLVIEKAGSIKSYIEVKSGPNDMDAAQIKHYADEIELIIENGDKAFIGETYGKREMNTVTHGLLKTYLKDWENKTLIGRELWDYITDNPAYHEQLIEVIRTTSNIILSNKNIVVIIDNKIPALIEEFNSRFSSMEEYYKSLW